MQGLIIRLWYTTTIYQNQQIKLSRKELIFRWAKWLNSTKKLEKVTQQQRRDCESAIINRGLYVLSDDFRHLEMHPEKWFSLNTGQREQHLKKFWEHTPTKDSNLEVEIQQTGHYSISSPLYEFSVTPEESGVERVALLSLKEMFDQAGHILQRDGSMVAIPFRLQMFMVESDSVKPHDVVQEDNGKVRCDDCPRHKSSKVCPHSFAVAEKCKKLEKFLTWYKRNSHTLSTTGHEACDSSVSVGRKSQRPFTSCRKGSRGSAPINQHRTKTISTGKWPPSPISHTPTSCYPANWSTQSCFILHFSTSC